MEFQNDHDLLVTLNTEMRLLRDDIREMKDGSKTTLQDHESRIRFMERYMWLAVGGLAVIEFFINYMAK